jgi:hypothetical protein
LKYLGSLSLLFTSNYIFLNNIHENFYFLIFTAGMSGRDTLYMGNEILYDPIYILIDLFIHVMDFVESGVRHHKPPNL